MSIGPSLTARDRTRTTTRTAETDQTSDVDGRTASGEPASFALQYAKWTFDPFNTRPCPEMFTDRWATEE